MARDKLRIGIMINCIFRLSESWLQWIVFMAVPGYGGSTPDQILTISAPSHKAYGEHAQKH